MKSFERTCNRMHYISWMQSATAMPLAVALDGQGVLHRFLRTANRPLRNESPEHSESSIRNGQEGVGEWACNVRTRIN